MLGPRALLSLAVLALVSPVFAERPSYQNAEPRLSVYRVAGKSVPDPYQWLEVSTAPEVRSWINVQNVLAEITLSDYSERGRLRTAIQSVSSDTRTEHLVEAGGYLFFERRDAGKEKPVVVRRHAEKNEERVVIDPNSIPPALGEWAPSPDGKKIAYAVHPNGETRGTLHVLTIDSATEESSGIPWADYGDVAWSADGSAIYYTRVPANAADENAAVAAADLAVHKLGTDPASDAQVFPSRASAGIYLSPIASDDGRWLFAKVWHGWTGAEIFAAPMPKGGGAASFSSIFVSTMNAADITTGGGMFYLLTTKNAPMGKIVSSPAGLSPAWKALVPERRGVRIKEIFAEGKNLVVAVSTGAHDQLEVYDQAGRRRLMPALPFHGSIEGLRSAGAGRVSFDFQSFAMPPRPMVLNLVTGRVAPFGAGAEGARADVRVLTFRSKDGTTVPMHLLRPDKEAVARPVLMRVYGGFGASMEPYFDELTAVLLSEGWGVAYPHLRGGGEYGADWHLQAVKRNKQKTFDDGIAAAEFLQSEGWAAIGRVAVQGNSNGGLTAGALITQRPELFCAAAIGVPILDMARFQLFGEGESWREEFGSPENPKELAALLAYSPYHNVRQGTAYPAVILSSSERDQRVHSMHARKMTAALIRETSSKAPVILLSADSAGHTGSGLKSDRDKLLGDVATFVLGNCREKARP